MSAKLAEQLAKIADLHAQLGEAYTELSALYDADSAKSGKSGDDGAAGKVSGRRGKAAVAPKGRDVEEDEVTEDDLKTAAKAVIAKLGDKKGKAKVAEILGGKLADVEEDDYAEKLAELKAAAGDEEEEEELPDPTPAKGKDKKGGKAKKVTEDDVRAAAKKLIDKLGEKKGKAKIAEILGGKLSDVDEDEYADKVKELTEALGGDEEEEEDDLGV